MGRGYLYILGIVVALAFVAGAGEISVRTSTCMACHQQEASFAHWMQGRLKSEKKGFGHELIACSDCHMKGSPANTIASRFEALLHVATYLVPQMDPRRFDITQVYTTARVPTENCNYCHQAAIMRKAVFLKDLPPELKKIGLVMDHRKHVIAREDTCAKCHERYQEKKGVLEAVKSVNYAEVNHMACDSCHTQASHAYRAGHLLPMSQSQYLQARGDAWKRLSTNPRWMVAIPSEQSCRRCHNGRIHFKTRIFQANCKEGTNFEDCKKCHALMTPEYFKQYRQKAIQTASGTAILPGDTLPRALAAGESDESTQSP
jgi:nitrate/TMAO reductase-like tetraheme cytochrome c subunit